MMFPIKRRNEWNGLPASLLLLMIGTANLIGANIEPGLPKAGGVDFVWIHDGNGWHIVPVDITAGMTVAAKADEIAKEIDGAGFDVSKTSNGTVSIAGARGVDKWEYHSHTGENDQSGNIVLEGKPQLHASLGFDGNPSGIGFPGSVATYSAEIGFDSVVASSFLTYASLFDHTLDGLLTATYANLHDALPSADQSLLSLDLVSGRITFDAPDGSTNFYVAAQSLDIATGSFVGGP